MTTTSTPSDCTETRTPVASDYKHPSCEVILRSKFRNRVYHVLTLTSLPRRTPIWTAFITHQVQSRRWMRQVSSKVVHLADLQRYIFTTDYTPQVAPGGKHELCFDQSSGTSTSPYIACIRANRSRCNRFREGHC